MCNKITKISIQSRFQWIGICSHGSAHVFWRTTHVCLPADQLEALKNQALAGKLPVECFGDEYLLWLNRVALKLSQQDYYEIQELFAYAVEEKSLPWPQQKTASEMNSEMNSEKGRAVLH
ncbi:MAG: hypothetical protein JKY50_01430 [Oleispira sp.]|nr:hypothetical protein [Oleispira sp.]MBL4879969.1 hypothetical protein [Oleispira sp.]